MRFSHRIPILLGSASLLVLTVAGCNGGTGSDAPGDFDVYVPSATPVLRVVGVDVDRAPLGLSEALVIEIGSATTGQPNQFKIAADSNGRVFALDVVDGALRSFDSTGEPIVWAETGTEALEFDQAPLGLGTNQGDVLLTNAYPGRLRLIDSIGDVLGDRELDGSPFEPTRLDDDTFVAMLLETGVVGRYSLEGDEIARYTVFQFPEEKLGGEARLWPHHGFAAGRGRVYVTTADTHQVTAFDIDGGSAWVLEGDVERIPIPEHISGKTLGRSRRAGRAAGGTIDTEYAQVKWPDFYPALAKIATDAQDRLYVFPYVIEENPERYPVDVYDATGAPITRGWLPFQGWDAFAGDAVYRIEKRGDMTVAVRYELDLQQTNLPGAAAGQ